MYKRDKKKMYPKYELDIEESRLLTWVVNNPCKSFGICWTVPAFIMYLVVKFYPYS